MARVAARRVLGSVALVGAGPGDPGLLTLRGQALLQAADTVVYDHLVSPALLEHCAPQARRVYAGQSSDDRAARQAGINRLLIRLARQGHHVVRLKGGDPFVFGRGGEEALALAKARIPFEVVPGVTSAVAVPAYAGIPVTHRGVASSVTFLTGHEDPAKAAGGIAWQALAQSGGTLVCLMAVGRLPGLVARLLREGLRAATPCALIERGTWPSQRTLTASLGTIAARARAARIQAPAILIIGKVVRLRRQIRWVERRPLFGRRVLVTRAAEKGARLTDTLRGLGAEVVALPAIALVPLPVTQAARHAVAELPQTDWVFFTSPEGVPHLERLLRTCRKDWRWLKGCHLAAIGPKTAEALQQRGLHVDVVARQYQQEGLLAALPTRRLKGQRAVLFNAAGSRELLAQGLQQRGMRVTRVPLYAARVPAGLREHLAQLMTEPWDAVTVTSASSVEHVYHALPKNRRRAAFRQLPFVSIGPVTSAAVRARSGRVIAQARHATIEGLISALCRTPSS